MGLKIINATPILSIPFIDVNPRRRIMTKWWIIGAAAFLAALLITSIALALTSRETEFAPGTPEAAVQAVLRAAENDDIEAAHAMLSPDLQAKCELKDYAEIVRFRYSDDNDRDIRATLRETKLIDGITFIDVRITEFHGNGPFGSGESTHNERYALRQENGEWRFTEYPWPYNYCPEPEE